MQIRGYLLVFSTQVGPLALAAHLLPGCGSRALSTWLAMHLSFLGWGVTLFILDRMLAHVGLDALAMTDEGRDSITTLVLLLIVPLCRSTYFPLPRPYARQQLFSRYY